MCDSTVTKHESEHRDATTVKRMTVRRRHVGGGKQLTTLMNI